VLEAQDNTIKRVDFYITKARLRERLRGQLNERQEKVVARMFREGLDGFTGGLSAENYISITKASRATATRDLQDLVEKGALRRTGVLRHARYYLDLAKRPFEESGFLLQSSDVRERRGNSDEPQEKEN
jgi:Fic family protein